MQRIISLLLTVAMLTLNISVLTSCGNTVEDDPGIVDPDNGTEDKGGDDKGNIIEPDYRDYGRRTVDFDEIVYARPDAEKLKADFDSVTSAIKSNVIPYDDQIDMLLKLSVDFENFVTMYSYSNLIMSKDSSDSYWCGEYEYISGYVPTFDKAIEDMYVAAAQSKHAENFEKDYFGDGLIKEYADGGIYTDKLVELMEKETELENRYSSLSTANVKITYKDKSDTLDNIMEFYLSVYGEETLTYQTALEECTALYEAEVNDISTDLLIELFKVRKQISDEMGYDSYATYAYETIYHDYSEEEALKFFSDVAKYVVPVYYKLSYYVLWPYFEQYENTAELEKCELINGLYNVYEDMSVELSEIYSYMLQYGLYNIENSETNRFDGSFCTYLEAYDAPFVFISTTGGCEDYSTLSHEFGHFVDEYMNYGSSSSLDVMEISSQGLEYLTLLELQDTISREEFKHLTYTQIEASLTAILFQSFYALFEHYAYDIAYEDISEEALIQAMKRAAGDMGMDPEFFNTLDYILIPHIILYPFYVQSYSTSAAVALEIYYMEKHDDGAGIEAYIELVNREDSSLTFEGELSEAGLTSPFSDDYLKWLADMIHYDIMGSHYYTENSGENAA